MSKYMKLIGQNAKKASLEKVNTIIKNNVLKKYVLLLDKEKNSILKANAKDVELGVRNKLKKNLIDRLTLDQKKLVTIRNSINQIIKLKDPIDNTLENPFRRKT